MRLPIIKQTHGLIKDHGVEELKNTINLLEQVGEFRGIKDEELDVVGELLSNFYGALEVHREVEQGVPEREALNAFMKRVMGSIG